jgi:hypothetical protein
MDPESVRTITTSAITALSTLTRAAIVAYFGYHTQKHTHKTEDLEKESTDFFFASMRTAMENDSSSGPTIC